LVSRLTQGFSVEASGNTKFFAEKVRFQGKKQTINRKPDAAASA
jgi:hypothetical protein